MDQLLPISVALVKNVEETLREIVQDAINKGLSKFPTLMQVVRAKVVNKIFNTKRAQTIEFIKQFLQMQKMSTDIVFAPVPLPNELGVWDATLVTNSNRERVSHPSMISKTMNHMKHLSSKLYPHDVITDIESTGAIGNYKVCWFSVNVIVAQGWGLFVTLRSLPWRHSCCYLIIFDLQCIIINGEHYCSSE